MTTTQNWLLLASFVFVIVVAVKRLRGSRTTKLRGPPRESLIFGQANVLLKKRDEAARIQAGWAEQYGLVFQRPDAFGSTALVLTDPKAIAHFHAGGETTYQPHPANLRFLTSLTGNGILAAMGHDHKRQRRSMTAGFSNVKMREYTETFLESAHKVATLWDQKMESSDTIDLDVTPWMNAISLDSMGSAVFAQDLGATSGKRSLIGHALDQFLETPVSLIATLVLVMQPAIPLLASLPTDRLHLINEVRAKSGILAKQILQESSDAEAKGNKADSKSVLGLLMKAKSAETGFPMDEEEINSLMRTLMLAGYDTTSVTMTWGLIRLAQNPDIQSKLRAELVAKFPSSDPTWDQLTQELPMLDAVVHETLRLHPSVIETTRQAAQDDVIPLGHPLTLPDGTVTDKIFVAAGATVVVPIAAVNQMRPLWGDDAYEYKPERWLNGTEGLPSAAKELQGHRHLLNFSNGPRTCLGKQFALAEIKAVLSVLVRNYIFEFPSGPDTKIRRSIAIIQRPTVVGAPRCHVPMRIRRYVA